jgi:hypothetical protein
VFIKSSPHAFSKTTEAPFSCWQPSALSLILYNRIIHTKTEPRKQWLWRNWPGHSSVSRFRFRLCTDCYAPQESTDTSYHMIPTSPLPDGCFENCFALRHLDSIMQGLSNCIPNVTVAFWTRCSDLGYIVSCFPHFLQESSGIVALYRQTTLPSTFFSINNLQ